jgi:hypothetical protein
MDVAQEKKMWEFWNAVLGLIGLPQRPHKQKLANLHKQG